MRKLPWIPVVIIAGTVGLLIFGGALFFHARAQVNKVALVSSPKLVTAVEAQGVMYRALRRYVGTAEPWDEAHVGPQLVSAYVQSVLVRPGAVVKRGQVLATLDCRPTTTESEALKMKTRASHEQEQALTAQAQRMKALLDGGYVSPNEVDLNTGASMKQAALTKDYEAQTEKARLEMEDCTLRAPFDGEVSQRLVDPGAFVHPGTPMLTVVDRSIVRMVVNVPEDDFDVVAPGTPVKVRLLATGKVMTAKISRRAPSADSMLRTVHTESDVRDPDQQIPVNTTIEVQVEAGTPSEASEVPLVAATVHGEAATLFVVDNDVVHAKTVQLKGERDGKLYLETALAPGSWVVTEGRTDVIEGDHVSAKKIEPKAPTPAFGGEEGAQIAAGKEGNDAKAATSTADTTAKNQ